MDTGQTLDDRQKGGSSGETPYVMGMWKLMACGHSGHPGSQWVRVGSSTPLVRVTQSHGIWAEREGTASGDTRTRPLTRAIPCRGHVPGILKTEQAPEMPLHQVPCTPQSTVLHSEHCDPLRTLCFLQNTVVPSDQCAPHEHVCSTQTYTLPLGQCSFELPSGLCAPIRPVYFLQAPQL